MTKIAIASTDGREINEHFGRARKFYVYEVDDDGNISETDVRIAPSKDGYEQDIDHLDAAVSLIGDVKYVLSASIGPHAQKSLQKLGITGFAIQGEIENALRNFAKRRKIIENIALCSKYDPEPQEGRGGCGSGGCGGHGDGSGTGCSQGEGNDSPSKNPNEFRKADNNTYIREIKK
ncbi:MAG: hypothetical protein LBN22_10180 [Clostridiales Family XIII bacterium]|jgi:nitrogen fixation protein NifB|nr:hypothetical protein [Clostridiales Family XIII bacterium]